MIAATLLIGILTLANGHSLSSGIGSGQPKVMIDVRAKRIAWSFLTGVTIIQGGALYWMFQNLLGDPARLERYFFQPQPLFMAWIASGVVTIVYAGYALLRSPLIGSMAFSPSAWRPYVGLRIVAVAEALVTGIFEEVFFRRFVMDWAAQFGVGAATQIALSGVVFGLAHGFWGFFTGNVRAGVAASIATGALGAALGAVYILAGRSLAPCIAAHVVMNLILEPWLILAAATGSWGRGTTTDAAPDSIR